MNESVIVIGGGISGLATAWWLAKAGVDVTVLEKNAEVGGTMKTVRHDGWLIETGPNSALETTPLIQTLCEDTGISDQKLYANEAANNRYILRNGVLHPLPMSPGKLLRSRLWSGRAKLRILKEPFIGRATREETIAEFVERRLGRELLDYAINPFVAGVFAGDPSRLSVQAAFPKLYALEEKYGSLIKGQIRGARERRRRGDIAKDRARLISFTDGMEALPRALARALGDRVMTRSEVESIVPVGGEFHVTGHRENKPFTFTCGQLIFAVPSYVASRWVRPLDDNLASRLDAIDYPPVAEIYLGYRRDQIGRELDGFGFLVPEKEKRSILGAIWSSVLFPNRALENHVALTTFVGGSRQPELAMRNDEPLIDLVHAELRTIMGMSGDPVFVRVSRWDRAIPQYALGHLDIMSAIERFESRYPGMMLSGNYRGGISVGDCVIQSRVLADRILERRHQRFEIQGAFR
jgi:oxygen-dependent protoporphyrinogen oxidase